MNRDIRIWLWGVIAGMCLAGFIEEARSNSIVDVTSNKPKITINHGA